jgi:hypothetical protein
VISSPALTGEYLKTLVAAERPLAQAIAERTGTDVQRDLLPRVMAAAVSSAVRAAITHWTATRSAEPLPALIRQAIAQVTGGMPAQLSSSQISHPTLAHD